MYRFAEIISLTRADIVDMENVARVMDHAQFKDFGQYLKSMGFNIWAQPINCKDYGIPQNRRRLVLLASRLGNIELLPSPHTKPVTVRETISQLESISAGGISTKDPLHRSRKLSKLNLERIQQSLPGGTWLDWDYDMRLRCHKRASGQSYTSVYTRMKWDEPAPTITTQFHTFGTGRFGHPVQDRALSLREGALLQTFPEDYKFYNPKLDEKDISLTKIGLHIGNAVPVKLGKVIGESIIEHVAEYGIK